MPLEDFRWIAEQCRGKVMQFALGGRGDPDQHEDFEGLLCISRENEIVPNLTTSGFGMTDDIARLCKRYCGAVAVSWYRNSYTHSAIEALLSAGVKTNIHYVLGNNSIDEAIRRLREDDFPRGINSVVFFAAQARGPGLREECAPGGRSARGRVLRGVRQGASVQGRPRQLYRPRSHQFLQERGAREPGHLRGRAIFLLHRP